MVQMSPLFEEPAQVTVDRYLDAIKDPDKRMSYLTALDSRMRYLGHQDWVDAIAAWRLAQQMK